MMLKASGVVFDRGEHTYSLNGKRLDGITKMLKYQLAPDKYKGISKAVLQKAADKGSVIHDACEFYDNFGELSDDYHVQDYARLTAGMTYVASEYIVTDGENFASPIDKVYRGSDSNAFLIGDIKTTSSLDEVLTAWQVSLYAYWFERQNPGAKVEKLFAIWLPDEKYQTGNKKPAIVYLNRVPDEQIEALLFAEINDGKYQENSVPRSMRDSYNGNSEAVVKVESDLPIEVVEKYKQYVIDILAAEKKAKEAKDKMLEEIRAAMEYYHVTKWQTDAFTFSLTAPTTRRTFSVELAKAKYPKIKWDDDALFEISPVKGSFKVTPKK